MTRARCAARTNFYCFPSPGGSASKVRGNHKAAPLLHDVVGRKGEAMRDLKSVEDLQAKFRATAKAAKAGTMRAKVLTRIDALQRVYAETAWVQRYYCTQFRFWRFCPFAPCRRHALARAMRMHA